MKEVVIVSRGNNAVGCGNGIEIKKASTSGMCANLEVLNEVLRKIPTEPSDTVRISLMDILSGINSGFSIEYAKTGKKADGTDLGAEEVKLYREFYNLYKDRLLNIRFNLVSYIPKMKDTNNKEELKAVKDKAYVLLNAYEKTIAPATGANVVPVTQTIDPDKELRDKLTQLMNKALDDADFDKYDKFKAKRDELKQPEIVTVSGQSSNEPAPTFVAQDSNIDDMDIDSALKQIEAEKSNGNAKVDNDDEPITFAKADSNKPNWEQSQANA